MTRRGLQLGAVAAVGLVIAAGAFWGTGGLAQPHPSSTPPTADAGPTHFEWTTVPFVTGDADVRWVGMVGDHLVATGRVGDTPAAWVSSDGSTWTRATVLGEAEAPAGPWDVGIGPVAERAGALLAPGSIAQTGPQRFTTVLWQSRDGGSTWSLTSEAAPIFTTAIVATTNGYFAPATSIGWSEPDEAGWWSADALTWEAVVGLPSGARVSAAANGDSLAAVGEANGQISAWHSSDGGRTWASVDVWEVEDSFFTAIAPEGPGYVAVGGVQGDQAGAAVWRSPDGMSWSRELLGPDADTRAGQVVPGPGGLAIKGWIPLEDGDEADVIWLAAPGKAAAAGAWPLTGLLGGTHPAAMTWLGGQLVAIASCRYDEPCDGALVLLGDPAAGPLPTLPPRTPPPQPTPSPSTTPEPSASEATPISLEI